MILMWPLLTLEKQWRLCATLSREHRAVSAQIKLKPRNLREDMLVGHVFPSANIENSMETPPLLCDRWNWLYSFHCCPHGNRLPTMTSTDMLLLFVLHRRHAASAMFPFSAPCLMRFYRCHRWTLASGRERVGFSARRETSLCGRFNHLVNLDAAM